MAVTSAATSDVTAVQTPGISLSKSANPSQVASVGQQVGYTFAVRNTGNVTLSSLQVSDPLAGLSAISCAPVAIGGNLAPNATTTCTATRATTQADLDLGQVVNTATVTTRNPAGTSTQATSSATVTATQNPTFTVTKTADPAQVTAAGQQVAYTIVVTNTGNVTLSRLRVVDPKIATLSCTPIAVGADLAPGAATTCRGTYAVTQADVDAGSVTNTATATVTPPRGADISHVAGAVVQTVRTGGITVTKTGSTATYSTVGQTITYTITAQNTGNITLTGVSVTDPLFPLAAPLSCSPATTTLTVGQTLTCTGTHTITQADLDRGSVVNTATGRGTGADGKQVSGASTFTATAQQAPAITVTKTANPTTVSAANSLITYAIVLTNTGNVTVTNAQVSDPLLGTLNCQPALGTSLAPNATMRCTGSYQATQADVDNGSIPNTAQAAVRTPAGATLPATADAVVSVTQAPKLTLAKAANPQRVSAVGQVVTYTFTVQNTGNVTASAIAVTDPMAGLSAIACNATTLVPGASTTCTATRATTQADLDARSGTITNTATVSAVDPLGQPVPSATATTTVAVTQNPALSLTKSATPTTVARVGDQVGYSMTVTNTGNTTVTGVTVTDALIGGLSCTPAAGATLAPNATMTCTGTRATTQADLDNGSIVNTASVTGVGPSGAGLNPVTARATVTATQTPSISLSKTADPASVTGVGQTITYTYVVTNTGNVTVGSVQVSDAHAGLSGLTCPATTSLLPGASLTCTATYSVTQADLNAGSIPDTANASAVRPGGSASNPADLVRASSSAVVTASQAPALTLTKTADATSYAVVGRVITYTYTVRNAGNVDVRGVQVADSMTGLGAISCTPAAGATLAPGAVMTCTASYAVTQSDIDNRSITNTATASGTSPLGVGVSAQATRTINAALTPSLSVSKSAAPTTVSTLDELLTYSVVVTNTGNVTVHGLGVSDPLPGLSAVSCPATTLAPGASTTCTATYRVTQADLDAGVINNRATVTALDTANTPVAGSAGTSVQVAQHPTLALTKAASAATYGAVGETIRYTFTVSNTGNTTINGVGVTDPLRGLSAITCQATTLAPGASTSCAATYTVTEADLDYGSIPNSATTTGTTTTGATVTQGRAGTTVTAAQSASLSFTKAALTTSVNAVGQVVSYRFRVTNTGNVTLGGVFVSDPLQQTGMSTLACRIYSAAGTDLRPGSGPVALAPGEYKQCTATYSVKQSDLDAGSIPNTAQVVANDPGGRALPVQYASALVTATQTPGFTLTKTSDVSTYSAVGQQITYTFAAANTGNVTLTNVTITDPLAGLSAMACTPAAGSALAPGERMRCTATHDVTQEDLDNRSIANTATAHATPPTGALLEPSASAVVTATLSPSLSLSKSADPKVVPAADTPVTYSFVVTNTGNVTLHGIAVADQLAGLSAVACPVTTLAPQASVTCTATKTVTQAELDAGALTNTATATGLDTAGTQASATASTSLTLPQAPRLTVTKTSDATAVTAVGQQIRFTFVVANAGNVTVNALALNDPFFSPGAVSCPQTSLAPGASMTCTRDYTVQQRDLDAAGINNVATVTGTTVSGAAVTPATGSTSIPAVQNPAFTLTKTPSTTSVTAIGQAVTYTLSVRNTGNVTLSSVFIADPQLGTLSSCRIYTADGTDVGPGAGPITLAPGQYKTCTGSRTFVQADFEQPDPNPATGGIDVVNTATVTGRTPQGTALTPVTAAATVYLFPQPDLQMGKTADATTYSYVGQVITFTLTARNTGNVALNNVQVDDPKVPAAAISCSPTVGSTLQPGQIMSCQAQYTVVQADIDAGSITNSVTATGVDGQGGTHQSSAAADLTLTYVGATGMVLSKSATPGAVSRAGEVVTFSFTVANTGDSTLTDVAVTDGLAGLSAITCPTDATGAVTVAPRSSIRCTATYTATQADIDSRGFRNDATATANSAGAALSSTASTTVLASHTPALTLAKSFTSAGQKTAADTVGDVVTYRFVVTNTGNLVENQIAVSDPLPGLSAITCPQTSLNPLASMTCEATYTITQTDLNEKSVPNTATVSGTDLDGTTVRASSSAAVPTAWRPSFTFEKSANPQTVTAVGSTVAYTFTMTNTGNVALGGLQVSDAMLAAMPANTCAALRNATVQPGASASCTGTYTLTQADIDAGSVVNVATLSANLPDDTALAPQVATATVGVTQAPSITATKAVDQATYSQVGQILHYSMTITNSGNVSLADVQLSETMSVDNLTCSPAIGATLASGATMSCTATHTVTQADLDARSLSNVVTATASGGGETVTAASQPAVSTATVTAGIDLVKTADTTVVDHAGQVITYTFVATNTGTSTLTNVTVVDPLPNLSTLSCGTAQPATLAPKASLRCTATYTVTQADIDAAQPVQDLGLQNTATVTGRNSAGTTATDSSSLNIPVRHLPAITLTKTASPTTFATVGEVVAYTFVITNSGNVRLTTYAVSDPLLANVVCPTTPLEPGQQATCTGSLSITQAELDAGTVPNTATATASDEEGTPAQQAQANTSIQATQNPHVSLTKTASPTRVTAVGQMITYTVTATNDGNVTLGNVFVFDPIDGLSTFDCGALTGPVSLSPGEVKTCRATRAATQADIDAGTIPNTAHSTYDDPAGVRHETTASAVVDVTQTSALTVTKAVDSTTYSAVGQVLTYTVTIRNTGNTSISGVGLDESIAVTDTTCSPALGSTLVSGQTMRCTVHHAVTQADLEATSIINVAAAHGLDPAQARVEGSSPPVVSTAILTPSLSVSKSSSTSTITAAGQVLSYTIIVTNTGNATLSGLTLSDRLAGASPVTCGGQGGPFTLAPGAELVCQVTYTVTQADIDTARPDQHTGVTNTVDVAAVDAAGKPATGSASTTVQVQHLPALTLTKSATPATVTAVGQRVTFSFVITNTGNVTMTSFVLGDALAGMSGFTCDQPLATTRLAPAGVITCTATRDTTQSDLDAGSVKNQATVTAVDTEGDDPATAVGSTTVTAQQNPSGSLLKSADVSQVARVGDQVEYTFEFTNTGNVTLSNVFIADRLPGLPTFVCTITSVGGVQRPGSGPVSVAPGEVKVCHATYTVTQADLDAGAILNTAFVTGSGPLGQALSEDSNPVVVNASQSPAIAIAKTVAPTRVAAAGDSLTYSFAITNVGSVTLTNVTLTDTMPGLSPYACDAPLTSIAPNAVIHCTATKVVTADEMNQPTLPNTATVTATAPTAPASTVSASSTATVIPVHQPRLTLAKTHDVAAVAAVGDQVRYSFEVTNAGNITVSTIAVTDPMLAAAGNAISCPRAALGVGESMTCSATYSVTQADLDRGYIANTADVTGVDLVGGDPVQHSPATDRVPVTQAPALSITKVPQSSAPVSLGQAVPFTITVTNRGNVTAHGVGVADDNPALAGLTCAPAAPATLAPGASMTCTATVTVQQSHVDFGYVDNTATASGNDPNGRPITPVSATASVPTVAGVADATIVKTPDKTRVSRVGEVVTYTITVTNTGTYSLYGPSVVDAKAGMSALTCDRDLDPVPLDPGQSVTCTATYTVTQADLDAGTITNSAVFTARSPRDMSTLTREGPSSVGVDRSPAITLAKSADRSSVSVVGDTITYTFGVRNTGNVTLSGVGIVDTLAGLSAITCQDTAGAAVPLPATLAPGVGLSCSASYAVTQADLDSGSVINAAHAVATGPGSTPTESLPSSTTVQATQTRALTLAKTADKTVVQQPGDQIRYTIVATNTGNTTLTNVRVSDPLLNLVSCTPRRVRRSRRKRR